MGQMKRMGEETSRVPHSHTPTPMFTWFSKLGTFLGKWIAAPEVPVAPAPIVLETERLVLRDLVPEDWRAIFVYRSDPEVLRYTARTEPYSPAEVRDLVDHYCLQQERQPRQYYNLGIVPAERRMIIGEIDLSSGLPDYPLGYLGFELRRDCWGKGYATEAAREMLRFGFEVLGLERIVSGCHLENHASARVLEKVGFRFHGFEAGFPGAPEGTESRAFEITREDWRNQRCATPEAG